MAKRILVTGGAGFIGSHLVDALVARGYTVRIFDNLDPQVHGSERKPPAYLNPAAELVVGDVRDRVALQKAVEGVSVIFHEAAAVGVGQSMYEIRRYVEVNSLGAANLLDILANERHTVEKLIVASSMSIYGEGKYSCRCCGLVYPKLRPEEQLARQEWEMRCPYCGEVTEAMATDEEKPLFPTSVYAVTKRDHEELCLSFGRAYQLPTVALRYFNVYGPRQALSNPYTGVAAIFSARILNNHPPVIYEDGLQTRDFIHVRDIVQANLLALEKEEANYQVFNVGSGRPQSILHIAEVLLEKLGKKEFLKPEIAYKFRKGDIRHCYADISRIQKSLGFQPQVKFEDGMRELTEWVKHQQATDGFEQAKQQLEQRGLTS
ncbi:MAG: NAD-dependent epimerase/dehydratase family protein [bacterium]|nr:NAD-dependent epimerase/dehydratase family protein [bacterium]